MILYIRTGCPFCQRVLDFAAAHNIALELREVGEGNNAEELAARGGKRQVPFLIDEERGVEMYESREIVTYLSEVLGIDDAGVHEGEHGSSDFE